MDFKEAENFNVYQLAEVWGGAAGSHRELEPHDQELLLGRQGGGGNGGKCPMFRMCVHRQM